MFKLALVEVLRLIFRDDTFRRRVCLTKVPFKFTDKSFLLLDEICSDSVYLTNQNQEFVRTLETSRSPMRTLAFVSLITFPASHGQRPEGTVGDIPPTLNCRNGEITEILNVTIPRRNIPVSLFLVGYGQW